ncbi:hypothetical protein COO60DRAFT_1521251 [Scenedesmus sp. NREL 46B-D3]|nr:hypothetical protein COO60DRAFT_1521251 [Scenedesmus sp. NREL 46B-D3]
MSCCHCCQFYTVAVYDGYAAGILLAQHLQHTTLGACYYRLGVVCGACSLGNFCILLFSPSICRS